MLALAGVGLLAGPASARHTDYDKLERRCTHNINKKIKTGVVKVSDKDAEMDKCLSDAEHFDW